jgi:hypothetical protein
MADFPSRTDSAKLPIVPTSRQFAFGQFPTKSYTTMNGVVIKRTFGNRPFGHTLDLDFANVNEDTVSTIFDHYEGQQGTTLGFKIPDNLLRGYENSIKARMQSPTTTQWFYVEPPSVTSGAVGLSSVTVKLVAELKIK